MYSINKFYNIKIILPNKNIELYDINCYSIILNDINKVIIVLYIIYTWLILMNYEFINKY